MSYGIGTLLSGAFIVAVIWEFGRCLKAVWVEEGIKKHNKERQDKEKSFIKERIAMKLEAGCWKAESGLNFYYDVAGLFKLDDYQVYFPPLYGDDSIDMKAESFQNSIYIHCVLYGECVSADTIIHFNRSVSQVDYNGKRLVVSLIPYSQEAIEAAKRGGVALMDADGLVRMAKRVVGQD